MRFTLGVNPPASETRPMTTLAGRHVVTPDGVLSPGVVELDGDRIGAVSATTGVVPNRTLVPGLVDLQVNGVDDVDVASARGSDWDRLDGLLLAHGVTTWCPTLVTAPLDRYAQPLARIAEAAGRPSDGGSSRPFIAGAHLEGPFLGGKPGAHPTDLIIEPDLAWLAELPDIVRVVTLAPEVPQGTEAISLLCAAGVLVSLGHSSATFEQATAGVDAGARLVTHGFNGMSGLHHREPGMVGAALTDDRVAVSLIADGVHVHPAALAVAFRCKPRGRVVLVTDAVAWRGGHDGTVGITNDGTAARLADGTLAGAVIGLDQAVAGVVHHSAVALEDAVFAAATAPADLLGLGDRGRLATGARADVVVLDDALRCRGSWVGGQPTDEPI